MEGVEYLAVRLAELLQLMFFAPLEEVCHLQDAFFIGFWGKGIVDPCLQISLAVFCLQPFGDEDDIDARETFVQESDVPTVFLRLVLLVKNGSVISLTYAVDDLCCLVAGGNSHEHASRHFAQVVDGGSVTAYVNVI